jgi:hypothetical protein
MPQCTPSTTIKKAKKEKKKGRKAASDFFVL